MVPDPFTIIIIVAIDCVVDFVCFANNMPSFLKGSAKLPISEAILSKQSLT